MNRSNGSQPRLAAIASSMRRANASGASASTFAMLAGSAIGVILESGATVDSRGRDGGRPHRAIWREAGEPRLQLCERQQRLERLQGIDLMHRLVRPHPQHAREAHRDAAAVARAAVDALEAEL